ncbi:MAG: LytTR family transcriptional regulator [Flavobacteriales bacterium]|nr:LytTR family transcriptional regulator [Flavobacteriales bacterium]
MVRKPSILLLGSEGSTRTPSVDLTEFGCDVRTASKVSEAAGICLFAPPDLVVVLEQKNGMVEFIEQLKIQDKILLLEYAAVTADGETEFEGPQTISDAVETALQELAESKMRAKHFFTKVGNKLRRIHLQDVRFIEVEGKYSAIHVGERKYNVKASLKDLLLKLPLEDFVRVSRNYVINIDRVTHIDTFQFIIKIDNDEIPISRTYKDELMKRIQLL